VFVFHGLNLHVLNGHPQTLVVLQLFHLLTARTRRTPVLPVPAFLLTAEQKLEREEAAAKDVIGSEERDMRAQVADEQLAAPARVLQTLSRWVDSRHGHVVIAVVVSVTIAVMFTEIEGLNSAFLTRPVEARYWLQSFGFGAALFVVGELRKWWIVVFPRGIVARVAW
jgi:hypothetical protein